MIAAYFGAVMAIGFWASRKVKTEDDFFLGGRKFGKASASAETAIDWRVDSAWLLAASSFVSASVRFDAPVCSTLIRFLLKSWRISTIERFEPSARCFRAQRGGGLRQRGQDRVRGVAVEEVGARGQRRQTEAGVVEGDAGDRSGWTCRSR